MKTTRLESRQPKVTGIIESDENEIEGVKPRVKHRSYSRRSADLRNALAARAMVVAIAILATPGLPETVAAFVVKLLKSITTNLP